MTWDITCGLQWTAGQINKHLWHWLGWCGALAFWAFVLIAVSFEGVDAAEVDASRCKVPPMHYEMLIAALHSPEISQSAWFNGTTSQDNQPVRVFIGVRGTITIVEILAPGVACIVYEIHDIEPALPDFPKKDRAGP